MVLSYSPEPERINPQGHQHGPKTELEQQHIQFARSISPQKQFSSPSHHQDSTHTWDCEKLEIGECDFKPVLNRRGICDSRVTLLHCGTASAAATEEGQRNRPPWAKTCASRATTLLRAVTARFQSRHFTRLTRVRAFGGAPTPAQREQRTAI